MYLSTEARYAASYLCKIYRESNPANSRGEWALVMALVVVGNAYPVTREADYDSPSKAKDVYGHCKLYGKPMDGFFDTHQRVDPGRGYDAADTECTAEAKAAHFHEVVLKEAARVLPRFIVFFKGLASRKAKVSGSVLSLWSTSSKSCSSL